MHLSRLGILGALTLLTALGQVASVSTARKVRHFGPIADLFEPGDGTATSSNWSGYAVLGSSFTWAKGSWIVPAARCTGVTRDQFAGFWVGLDGYRSTTVEQTGTDTDCIGSSPSYYAWYEFYPRATVPITTVPVKPGDAMSAMVSYDSSTEKFTIKITNETTGKTFSTASRVSGAVRSSAEWIAEAPCCTGSGGILPLPNFGTVTFGKNSTGVSATNYAMDTANTGAIGSFPPVNIIKINKYGTTSSPELSDCSALSKNGTS